LLIGIFVIGGVILLLPVVLMDKIQTQGIVKTIGAFLLIIVFSAIFYLVTTDANLDEILTLKANTILLPKRIFSASYTMILILITILPVAIVKNRLKKRDEKA